MTLNLTSNRSSGQSSTRISRYVKLLAIPHQQRLTKDSNSKEKKKKKEQISKGD